MNAAKQAIWIFAIMMVLACSGWYFASEKTPRPSLNAATLATTADTIVLGLNVRQFNTDGLLNSYLESKHMQHIPGQDIYLFQEPHVIISQDKDPTEPAWEINAQKAEAIEKGQRIVFRHKVIVHQGKGRSTEESTMNTERLFYFPQKKLATSDKAVVFKQSGSTVHSQGMTANLENKHVELLGQARIVYEPRHA